MHIFKYKKFTRSVQPFWRLLDTKTRHPSKVYITRLLRLLLQLLTVALSVSIFSLYSIKQKQKKLRISKYFLTHFQNFTKKTDKPSRVMWCPTKMIIDKNNSDKLFIIKILKLLIVDIIMIIIIITLTISFFTVTNQEVAK